MPIALIRPLEHISIIFQVKHHIHKWTHFHKSRHDEFPHNIKLNFSSFVDSPRFKVPPKHAEIELGDDAVLECEVDSNPTAYIVWRRKEDPGATIIGRDRQLVVPKVSAGKLGIYTCSASMPDFNQIEAEFHILKKGK